MTRGNCGWWVARWWWQLSGLVFLSIESYSHVFSPIVLLKLGQIRLCPFKNVGDYSPPYLHVHFSSQRLLTPQWFLIVAFLLSIRTNPLGMLFAVPPPRPFFFQYILISVNFAKLCFLIIYNVVDSLPFSWLICDVIVTLQSTVSPGPQNGRAFPTLW